VRFPSHGKDPCDVEGVCNGDMGGVACLQHASLFPRVGKFIRWYATAGIAAPVRIAGLLMRGISARAGGQLYASLGDCIVAFKRPFLASKSLHARLRSWLWNYFGATEHLRLSVAGVIGHCADIIPRA
jgi:hypothetical protein